MKSMGANLKGCLLIIHTCFFSLSAQHSTAQGWPDDDDCATSQIGGVKSYAHCDGECLGTVVPLDAVTHGVAMCDERC
eukprot:2846115-Rhodomonas_salina.1